MGNVRDVLFNFVILTVWTVLSLIAFFTDIAYNNWPETDIVSNFYGPGVFLAWFWSALFTLTTYTAASVPKARSPSPRTLLHTLGRTVTFGYTAFAAGDALVRNARNSHIGEDAQLGAALTVCRYAVVFSSIAQFPEVEGRERGWWTATLVTAATPIVLSELRLCFATLHWFRALVPLGLAVTSLFSDPNARALGFVGSYVGSFGWCMFWLVVSSGSSKGRSDDDGGIYFLCRDSDGARKFLHLAIAWPRSDVAWSELDQVAALTSVIVSLLLALLRTTRVSRLVERWGRDQRTPELLQRTLRYLKDDNGVAFKFEGKGQLEQRILASPSREQY